MNKLAIIGAGGHARSVIDLFQQMNEYEIIGCLDPCYKVQKTVSHMQNMPIIGDDSLLESLSQKGIEYAFVALGDNKKREKMMRMAKRYSLKLATAISPGAYISPNANIGEGSCIMAGAVLNVNCAIGKGVIINTNASIDHDCKIGNYVHIAPGTAISGYTTIEEGTHIGTNAAVIDGIHIGKWSYIGAGAVVVKDLSDHVMAYGVPARFIKYL